MDKIIEKMERQIRVERQFYSGAGHWDKHNSIIITPREAQKILDELKYLRHYRDSTVGLWATDKPEKVQDPENVMFMLGDK